MSLCFGVGLHVFVLVCANGCICVGVRVGAFLSVCVCEGVCKEIECLPLCIPQLVCSLKQENESHKVVVRPVQSKQTNQSRKYLFPEV